MKPKPFRRIASILSVGAASAITFSGSARAATITKADNTSALDLGISWGGTAPGSSDIANWSGTYTTAGSLSAALPAAALSWQGITAGALSGAAAGTVSIGGTGAAVASSGLSIGSSGIDMTGASHDMVINAATLTLSGSQTWTVPAGRNLRLGSSVLSANVDGAGGDSTVITLAGGGTVDANQGAANGFADYTGKWIVQTGTTLRGIQSGTNAWGSNTSADAILLNGGKLAVGGITGSESNCNWPTPISLGLGTTSYISGQHSGSGAPTLALQGAVSGNGALVIEKLTGGTGLIVNFEKPDNGFTGGTTISPGALAINGFLGTTAGTKTPLGTGDITVGSGAALEFKTNAASDPSSAAVTIGNNINLNTATLRCRDALQTYNGTITLTGANTIRGEVDLKHTTLTGLIQDGATAGSLTLRSTGSQKMILPYPNTYTGGTILGTGTSNTGIVVLGDAAALGTGAITVRGAQIWSDVPGLVISNSLIVGGGTAGGLCVGGVNDISFTGSITVDNASRAFQNSGTGLVTLAGINLSSGSSATAAFGSATAKGPFTVTGPITGAGKITVSGGPVTLSGASTYTGTTTISSTGRLVLTGSLTSAIAMTGASASIAGSGSTTGGLTTTGTSAGTIYLDPANPTQAISANAVSFNGATKVDILSQQPLGTTTYTVVKYGTLGGLANLSSPNVRGVFTDDTVNKKVTLAVTSANRTWNHAVGTTWNLTDANWIEGDNKYFNGDAVTFGDAGAGTVTLSGALAPYSVTFNNTTGNNYTLASSTNNLLTGPTGLTVSGTGTVQLSGANSFTGKIQLSAGILAIQADNNLGAIPSALVEDAITFNGGTLKFNPASASNLAIAANRGITLAAGGGTIDTTPVTSSFTATVAGEITGTGDLTVLANGDTSDTGNGFAGATVLSGYGTFLGNTTIKSGVVTMDSYFGDISNPVTLDGGGIVDQNHNNTFSQEIRIGAAGGVIRSYGSTTSTISGPITNAAGVTSASIRLTDTGIRVLSGDGSAFAGTITNSRGTVYIDSPDWSGTNLVSVDATEVRFGSGAVSKIKSIATDNNLHIETGTTLDVTSGNFTVQAGLASTNFSVQNDGTLTSSSGTLAFNFQTPYITTGADSQAVNVLIADYDGATPLTVVKNGPGALANFNKANTYTGGTIINGGRINAANVGAFGTGNVTVNSGGQAYLITPSAIYPSPFTIEGTGPTETAGNLGALRLENNSVSGDVTVANAGARLLAYSGATGTISGSLLGSGNLEINSPAANHNGTITLAGFNESYTGTITVAQGRMNLNDRLGGSVSVSDGATLGGEGEVMGTLTLGSTTGANLRVNGTTVPAILAGNLVLNGTSTVHLDSIPNPLAPVKVVEFTNLTGSTANLQVSGATAYRTAFVNTGTSIDLNFITETRTWAGTVDGNWNSTALNWVEGDKKFFTGDSVVFNDSGTNKTIVIPSPVSPASVLFNNSTGNNYSVAGRMIVTDGGNLVKQGTGTVTMTGTSSNVTGLVQVDGGSLVLGTTDYTRAVGASTGIVVNGGTLRLNGINILYDGGGSTTVTVNAGGTVELNAYHNHFKTLNLNGGTIIGMRSDADTRYNNEYTTFDTSVTVGGTQMSTISRISGGAGLFNLAGAPFDVADVAVGTDLLVSAPLTGGVLTKNGAGTMTLTASNTNTGNIAVNAGVLDVSSGGLYRTTAGVAAYNNTAVVTVASGGTLRLKSFAYDGDGGTGGLADYAARRVLSGGTIEVTGSTHSSGNDFTVAASGGTFRYNPAVTSNTLTLSGNANANIDLAGTLVCETVGNITIGEIIGGAGSIQKTGAGTLTLNAANTYTGATTVTAGTLKGTGSLAGPLTVAAAGTVAPGNSAGTLTAGSTTLNGSYACEINGSTADRLTVNGNLTIAASGASIAFATLAPPSQASYVIASYTGTFNGNIANLTITGLPSGYSVTHNTGTKQLLLVGTPSGYNSWASTNGISGESGSDDHDKDGISNAVEWVLGGNPNVSDTGKLPVVSTTGGNLVFTFIRNQSSKTPDTAVSVEVGTTLGGWPSVYTVGNDTAGSTPGITVTDNGNGTDTVTLSIARAPDAAKFARLKVTVN